MDSLDELEIADYDALVEATKDAQDALFPSIAKTNKNESNPKADTTNSKG